MIVLLKQIIKKLGNGIIIGIGIILSIGIFFIAYASFTSMTPVGNGSPLTSSAWNLMVSNLDDLNGRLNTLNTTVSGLSATPTGAVMAFNLASCPTGWTALASAAGRVIVGKSAETEFDTLGETGGAKTHTLTIAEMPSHSHTVGRGTSTSAFTNVFYGTQTAGGTAPTSSTGDGGAHNNLQPYLTLLYCQKN